MKKTQKTLAKGLATELLIARLASRYPPYPQVGNKITKVGPLRINNSRKVGAINRRSINQLGVIDLNFMLHQKVLMQL